MEDVLDAQNTVNLDRVRINDQYYFKIVNHDQMRPFFMSIVSDSDHWMFISSNGGLTAGRKNSEFAIFPYYSDDKITESAELTGSKTICQVKKDGKLVAWEPFSIRDHKKYNTRKNLYKSIYGNSIIFEEVNLDLQMSFQYEWASSDEYGFVKKSKLVNHGPSEVEVTLLDGIQNVLPYGVNSALQNASSNLVDAYKRTELESSSGIGIFALSAIIVDKAEPSEALKANVAWSLGLDNPKYLLSSLQLDHFRQLGELTPETDVKAEKGAYFVFEHSKIAPNSSKQWAIVANVNYDRSAIVKLSKAIKEDQDLPAKIEKDIVLGTKKLIALNAASDGLQTSSDHYRDSRHFANTLFNIMRGGIFDDGYTIEKWDFENYLKAANKEAAANSKQLLASLGAKFNLQELKTLVYSSEDEDFSRLAIEYMPLKFSRRHGDPSRPWNKFSINTRSEIDGTKILDYEGNWRDIFQNWEALVRSYPEYIENMIFKFLNASTFDGYNPYRVTKGGFDWEIIEPDDPWSYIGYWGDHQIIYLLKFLEFIEDYKPGRLSSLFDKELFVYANVPYKIKAYKDLLKNPKDTIEFDDDLDHRIRTERAKIGADGALLKNAKGGMVRANFLEKILATTLSKLSNYVPEGGIWMNTQRPEWNDANNALVGNGVSMVTLYYLRRFLRFFEKVLAHSENNEVKVSDELAKLFNSLKTTFSQKEDLLNAAINDKDRRAIMDELGTAGSKFREQIYNSGFSGDQAPIQLSAVKEFIHSVLQHLEHAIDANRREDDMYHAYNIISIEEDAVAISYLDEMLEGQVAVLSSAYLSSSDNLKVLDGLKHSKLFRPDQYSYLLYPNKELKGFMQRNHLPEQDVKKSELLMRLMSDGHTKIIKQDLNGVYHFNGNFKNAEDLNKALEQLEDTSYADLVAKERKVVLRLFEKVFNHKAFTGRSGTFYGYEGLGSIYWHMVSKLQLAVYECCVKAIRENENEIVIGKLLEHYYEINEGIGVHKSPALYGAFPTDPYSHTPFTKGAQQPGMTGQVKEDILSRMGELGVYVDDAQLHFSPDMLRANEFLSETTNFNYVDLDGEEKVLELSPGMMAFTCCQVPVLYRLSEEDRVHAIDRDNQKHSVEGITLTKELSASIFNREALVSHIIVDVNKSKLK